MIFYYQLKNYFSKTQRVFLFLSSLSPYSPPHSLTHSLYSTCIVLVSYLYSTCILLVSSTPSFITLYSTCIVLVLFPSPSGTLYRACIVLVSLHFSSPPIFIFSSLFHRACILLVFYLYCSCIALVLYLYCFHLPLAPCILLVLCLYHSEGVSTILSSLYHHHLSSSTLYCTCIVLALYLYCACIITIFLPPPCIVLVSCLYHTRV